MTASFRLAAREGAIMSYLRLSRSTLAFLAFALAVLVLLLLSSVRIAGAAAFVPDPPPKKGDPKGPPAPPVRIKDELQENDPNDPIHDQPCKTYQVKLLKGKTYVIDMMSKDFDCYLRLEDSTGKQLAEDDDGGGELDAQIVFTAESDDTYKIIATRFAEGIGNFTLKVRELSYKTGKELALDKGLLKIDDKLTNKDPNDPVGPKNRCKTYSVKMTAGKTYTIDLVSGNFDAFLRLTDATFKKLAEDDDGGGDQNARVVFVPKADGVYHIVATTYDGDLGAFTLTVREEK
jgi:hypothetical protein